MPTGYKLTQAHELEIVGSYQRGESGPMIGKRLGVSVAAIMRCLHRNNIPIIKSRPVTEAQKLKHSQQMRGRGKGVYKTTDNYVKVRALNHPFADSAGNVMQHRLVVEAALGRYLQPEETVHHKNGIKNDNRLENLELLESRYAHVLEHSIYEKIRGQLEPLLRELHPLEASKQLGIVKGTAYCLYRRWKIPFEAKPGCIKPKGFEKNAKAEE